MYQAAIRWLIMLLMAVFATDTVAQVAYHNFNANSGLPSNEVYCAFQDKDGYMWFGTDHGVAKYNGYEFKIYSITDGLTDNTVFDIKQDRQGNLWFLTLTGGICYYDGIKFMPHPMNDTIAAICRGQMPTSWHVGDNYTVWLAGIKEGFYKVSSTGVRGYLSFQPKHVKNEDGEIWVVKLKDGGYVYTLIVDDNYKTFSDVDIANIVRYELHWDYLNYYSTNFQLVNLPDSNVLMAIDRRVINLSPKGILAEYIYPKDQRSVKLKMLINGDIWLTGINAPLYKVDAGNGRLLFTDSVCGIPSVSDITDNERRNIWLTTVDKGAYILPEIGIRRYEYGAKLTRNKITYFKAGTHKLYVPITGNTILTIDSTMGAKPLEGPKETNPITSMVFDENGKPLTNYDHRFHQDSAAPHPEFFFTKIAYLGKLKFIAGGTGGFALFDDEKLVYSSRNYGFLNRVTDIIVLKENSYVIGTTTGLYYFNSTLPNGGISIEPILKEVRITSLALSNGRYAVATRGKGVYVFEGGKAYQIDERLGLVSNLTEDVFFENDTSLWVATFQGISKVMLRGDMSKGYKIYSYTTDDGLCSNQINAIEKFNGRFWLATNEGLCYFLPEKLRIDTAIVPIYITSVAVNGRKPESGLDNLMYDNNNISIEYNALYYNAVNGVRYKVRLLGLEEWRYTDRNSVQYYVLPAGNYTFQVAAEDKYGRYVSEVKQLKFTINPHYTNTRGFKIIVGLLILIIAALIVYLLFAYQRFKARNVIRLLQSEFKALNYQINPHFIFNVLNSIQYYILRKDSDKAVSFLNSFSTLIRRIVSNSRQQYISVIEEVECLKEYLDLEKLRLENKFDYELNIDSNVDIERKMMLPMIIQPLVENSIWHGIVPLDGRGKIKVDFKIDDEGALICIVDDNGVGINSSKLISKKEQNNLSLAMSNVKERLKIIGELNGSEWFINFKDKSELGNKEHGTIVTIRFPIARMD